MRLENYQKITHKHTPFEFGPLLGLLQALLRHLQQQPHQLLLLDLLQLQHLEIECVYV
jgi:hypothetical protein